MADFHLPSWFLAEGGAKNLLTLGNIDLFIIAIYFVVVLGIGVYLKRFAKSGEDFFMAGHKMTAWIAGLSFISANLSSLETMGWSGMAAQYGMPAGHAYLIGAIPAILFLAVVMMPFYYICRTHSVPGYLKLRYGEGSRGLAGISFAAMTVLVCGVNMFAMAKIMELLLGWNLHFSIWVSSVTVAVYVALGGLLSAIFNEVLQYFLVWLGLLLIPILGLCELGGWTHMIKDVESIKGVAQNFTHLWAGMGDAKNNAMGANWFIMVFGLGLAISFGYWCTDFLQVQRVMAAKDLRSAENGTIIGAGLKMLVLLIVTVPGLLAIAILEKKCGIKLVGEDDPSKYLDKHQTYNVVLPLLMARYLGPGLLGLGVTAMIAGFMSGMAGNVSAFATVWTYDVYKPLIRKSASDAHYVSMGRWSSIIGVFIGIATAYAAMLFSNILVYLQVLVAWFIVPLFGAVLVGMLWKRSTAAGGFWGFLAGILVSVFGFFFMHYFPSGYSQVSASDIASVPAFCKMIDQPGSPAATYLRGRMSADTQALIHEALTSNLLQTPGGLMDSIRAMMKSPDENDKKVSRLQLLLAGDLNTAMKDKTFAAAIGGAAPEANADEEHVIAASRQALMKALPGQIAAVHTFNPTQMNPHHAKLVTGSPNASDFAFNLMIAFCSLVISIVVNVMLSLVTKPKPESELKDLVMGLTPLPDTGKANLFQKPVFWAGVVAAILVAINIIYW